MVTPWEGRHIGPGGPAGMWMLGGQNTELQRYRRLHFFRKCGKKQTRTKLKNEAVGFQICNVLFITSSTKRALCSWTAMQLWMQLLSTLFSSPYPHRLLGVQVELGMGTEA